MTIVERLRQYAEEETRGWNTEADDCDERPMPVINTVQDWVNWCRDMCWDIESAFGQFVLLATDEDVDVDGGWST